ncbi:MAG: ATP-binding cassette domain-containing protein [Oscillospiraceae bacterium]
MSIILKDISKSYDDKKVLNKLSLELLDGERYAVMGKSGTGKTTLLRIICGLTQPDTGSVTADALHIAMVFQENRLVNNMSAIKNIAIFSSCTNDKILSCAKELCLTDEDMHKSVQNLSGGQRTRVAILRAVVAERTILLLDAPLRGLDDVNKQKAISFILRYHKGLLVLVTHDENDAVAINAHIISLG